MNRRVKSQNSTARTMTGRARYPFTAIVGQETMKLALILNVIDSLIGGVLIMGHRGTGKSTAVRALADLLPEVTKIKGCKYNCDPKQKSALCEDCRKRASKSNRLQIEKSPVPVVDLPLGATEDRICGTIDIERALASGVKAFEPGLLAKANRGFLYIDEVNLLEDHLVDVLLDVAASGRNIVEREGISVVHPARFVLIGSGNPEEGELRPQLLDRFGLFVEVETIYDLDQRIEIVKRRETFERDPEAFAKANEPEQLELRQRIVNAQKTLSKVTIEDSLLRKIAELCIALKIDGHRGELTIARSASALAAFEGRDYATEEDIRRVSQMCLRHRLRKDPLESYGSGGRIDQAIERSFPDREQQVKEDQSTTNYKKADNRREGATEKQTKPPSDNQSSSNEEMEELIIGALNSEIPNDLLHLSELSSQEDRFQRLQTGRSNRATQHSKVLSRERGKHIRSVAKSKDHTKLDIIATLRAAAPYQRLRRERTGDAKVVVKRDDFRFKQFKQKAGSLYIFIVDGSGSMALNRINQAKGAIARILEQSYLRRDKIALISFRKDKAEVLLQPSQSVALTKRSVDALPVGGGTPLAAGLIAGLELADRARRQGRLQPSLVLFTDGRANVGMTPARKNDRQSIQSELSRIGEQIRHQRIPSFIIDTRLKFTSAGEGQRLASMLGGRYVYLPRADSKDIAATISSNTGSANNAKV